MSLALQDIHHTYGEGAVVDGASLEAARGEIVALFGPSGCGKTTLLRIAAGLERVQSGSVMLDGEAIARADIHVAPEKRAIGFVFQDFVLFPHLTVEQNIAFGLDHLSADERRASVASELRQVELSEFARRYPHELSGGQQQRAALARAFARRPRAMLLDEPFASIDVALRQRLRGELRRLLKMRETPTIFVTHDPIEAVEVGDRIAVMRSGCIIETASPDQLYAAPKTLAGGTIFSGSQAVAVRVVEGVVVSDFGRIDGAPANRATSFAVIHDGGAIAEPAADGDLRVVDCRFAGPVWIVAIEGRGKTGPALKAQSDCPLAVGAAVKLRFLPDKIRLIA